MAKLCTAKKNWKTAQKNAPQLRQRFLAKQAKEHAAMLNTTKEKALHTIIVLEDSKKRYRDIHNIVGDKDRLPLIQIDIIDPEDPNQHLTINTKIEMEQALIERNQRHSRQSLQLPFATIPDLVDAINPKSPMNKIEHIRNGELLNSVSETIQLTEPEKERITELKKKMHDEFDTYISMDGFTSFFKKQKEQTVSLASGHHMGHYKVFAEKAEHECFEIVDLIVTIINTSLITACPLHRWLHSAQII
jgi:hypothetical protein